MRLQDIRGIGTRGKSLELKIERFRLEFGKEFFPVREPIPGLDTRFMDLY